MRYLAILGQNPELSLAELRAVYPNIKIELSADQAVIFDSEEKIDIGRLGGTPKLAEVLPPLTPPLKGRGGTLSPLLSKERRGEVIKDIKKIITAELLKLGTGQKIFFGLSFYDSDANDANYIRMPRMRNELGKDIKKTLVEQGYKIRWVTSNELALSSVVIKTNKLLTRGFDFNIVFSPHTLSPSLEGETRAGVCIAKTVAVQDFSDYEFRDMRRPCRDLYSGMTPPKLAKMLINLANLSPSLEGEIKEGVRPEKKSFLDPFCGSGTFLAEAALLGYKKICGSDVSAKAVSDSQKNIDWLIDNYKNKTSPSSILPLSTGEEGGGVEIKLCDIKNISTCWNNKFSSIATEPYLGSPIRGELSPAQAEKLQKELSGLYEIYLKNLSSILEKNGTLVLIVPFFISGGKRIKINLELKKADLSAARPPILYSRPDQKVGREIFILKKI